MGNEAARLTILDNGLTVVTRYAERAVSTDITIKILAGSRDEVAGDYHPGSARHSMHWVSLHPRGTAHFDEHRVCDGSANYPGHARKLIEHMEGFDKSSKMKHHFTPATQFQFTNYSASVPAASTYPVLDIMGDMVARPLFREQGMEKERKYILNEGIENQLSYGSSNSENWIVPHVAFGESPLLSPIIGDKQSIQEITVNHLKDFHARNVTGHRIAVAVEGDVKHDEVVKAIEKRMSSLPAGMRPASEAPVYTGGDARYWLYGDGGAHVAIAFKAPREGDFKAGIAFKVAAELLTAEGSKHSIPDALHDLGIYKHSTLWSQTLDSGLLTVTFNAMDTKPCLEAVQKVLSGLTRHVDDESLAQVRKEFEKHIKSTETLFKVGSDDMAGDVFLHGRVMPPDHYSRLKLQTTKNDIREAVREILSHPPTFVAAGDLQPLPPRDEVRGLFFDEKKEVRHASASPQTSAMPVPQYA